MEEKRCDAGSPTAASGESPASEPTPSRRRAGGQKRKAASLSSSGSSSPPLKRATREKAALLHPQIHNGPLTRALQAPAGAGIASKSGGTKPAAEQARVPGVSGVEAVVAASVAKDLRKESELQALEAGLEARFEAIRSRSNRAHVVPSHCVILSHRPSPSKEQRKKIFQIDHLEEDRKNSRYSITSARLAEAKAIVSQRLSVSSKSVVSKSGITFHPGPVNPSNMPPKSRFVLTAASPSDGLASSKGKTNLASKSKNKKVMDDGPLNKKAKGNPSSPVERPFMADAIRAGGVRGSRESEKVVEVPSDDNLGTGEKGKEEMFAFPKEMKKKIPEYLHHFIDMGANYIVPKEYNAARLLPIEEIACDIEEFTTVLASRSSIMRTQIDDLLEKNGELRGDLKTRDSMLAAKEAECGELSKKVASLIKELERRNSKIGKLKKEVDTLGRKLEKIEEDFAAERAGWQEERENLKAEFQDVGVELMIRLLHIERPSYDLSCLGDEAVLICREIDARAIAGSTMASSHKVGGGRQE